MTFDVGAQVRVRLDDGCHVVGLDGFRPRAHQPEVDGAVGVVTSTRAPFREDHRFIVRFPEPVVVNTDNWYNELEPGAKLQLWGGVYKASELELMV